MARRRTTVNGRHGRPQEVKHLQDERGWIVGSHKDCRVEQIESQKVEQENRYKIEDINAATVVYANYSKSRSNARDA